MPTPAPVSSPARRCRPGRQMARKIGAEQKLFGGVSISGSIGETRRAPRTRASPPGSSTAGNPAAAGSAIIAPAAASRLKDPALPHNGRDAVKIGSPDGRVTFVVRGTSALAQRENRGKADELSSVPEKLNQLKRTTISTPSPKSRPASATSSATTSPICAARRRACREQPERATALEPSTEATVNNVNSLIQRVAGTSLSEIENLIAELEALRDLLHARASACSARFPAMPSSARPP